MRIVDIEFLHIPRPHPHFAEACDTLSLVFRVQVGNSSTAQVDRRVFTEAAVASAPKMQLHAFAPQDQLVFIVIDDFAKAKPIAIEGQRLRQIQRRQDRQGLDAIGVKRVHVQIPSTTLKPSKTGGPRYMPL